MSVPLFLVLAICSMSSGQGVSPPSAIRFTEITDKSGIDFSITCGKTPASEILEVNGGGLALIDFDNDGDLDLFVANGATLENPESGPGCKLFENLGGFRFQDVTDKSKIAVRRWAMGAAVGDYDGDGFDDIYLSCFGPDLLLRNAGNGTFTDVTSSAKISDDRWGASAAFGDIDNDGDLDVYVTNYLEFDVNRRPPRTSYKNVEVMAGPHGLQPQHDILYENLGDGTFRDITEESGCLPKNPAFGLNVVFVDVDNDNKQDIIVANDSMPTFLFHNLGPVNGRPKFEEIGVASGISANADGGNQAAMGLAIADVDGNGFPDKFTTVFSSDTNALHMNLDGRFFEDRSQQFGLAMISRPFLGWSTAFYDFDHDGDEDLFMVNGHVYPEATMESMDSEFAQPPLLFARDGKRFRRVQPGESNPWLGQKHRDRNAVFGDFDSDGDIDIIIGELNGPIRVLRNEMIGGDANVNPNGTAKDWLIVELSDGRSGIKNRRGLGSRIELQATDESDAASKQRRWLVTGGGFQSSGAPYVHFAVPHAREVSLTVIWTDGSRQQISNVQLGQRLRVERTQAP